MLIRTLVVIALAYAAVLLLAWFFQHRLLYLPTTPGRAWTATPDAVGLAYDDLRIRTGDDVELSAWLVPSDPERGLLLFFHGNAGNISHRLESIEIFHRLGLSVLIVDYRGYGRSGGTPSETGTYRDAAAVWRFATAELGRPADRIVVYGRSLGAAVAAQLATTVAASPAALIVESPFTTMAEMAQRAYPFLPARWLTRFSYATRDYVAEAPCPVLVAHSTDDEIVPLELGRAVYAAAPEPKRFFPLTGGHNTAFRETGDAYLRGIDAFLTEVAGLRRYQDAGAWEKNTQTDGPKR